MKSRRGQKKLPRGGWPRSRIMHGATQTYLAHRTFAVVWVLVYFIRTSSAFTLPAPTIRRSLTSSPYRYSRCQLTRNELESMTMPALKEQLKKRGLKVGGKKAELVDRLLDSFGSAHSLNDELEELCDGPLEMESSSITAPDISNSDDGDVSWGGENIPTYQEYVEELQAMAFLSSIGDEEACDRAQLTFDDMYENRITEDDASLEPTTEIYNLLIEAYAESSRPNVIEVAEKILDRMESSSARETGDGDDDESEAAVGTMPLPDINTYIAVLKGYANRAQPMAADATFRRLYDRFMTTGDKGLMPTTEAYNQLIRAWMKSGTRSAASVTENLLNEMIDAANDDAVMPNVETFARVLNCHTQASKGKEAPANVQRLMDQMQDLYESGIETLKPNAEVYNVKIKSLAVRGVPDGAVRAVDTLQWMVNEYRKGNEDLCPTRATFIAAINAQTSNGGKRAAQESEGLFAMMQSLAKEVKDDELLPNVRVYNALIRCWARSKEKNKAERTRQLLETMEKESELRGDDELTPNLQTYNGVLNACSFPSRGNSIEEKYAAFRIAVQTLNELRASENCEPNHVSYGTFLRSCGNLMPPSPKRDAVVGNIFRKCCEEGLVSEFVMDSVSHAASENLKSTLFEDVVGGKLPRKWSCNL